MDNNEEEIVDQEINDEEEIVDQEILF